MTRDIVKVGVVGCGVVATAYYLPYLLNMQNAEIVAVCDIYPERTKACVRLFGAKEIYDDYYEMIERADIDAVMILTGPGTHVDFTLRAIQAGKHVLIQKPMAIRFEDAKTIAAAARQSNLKVLVEPSENSLLNNALLPVRKLIDAGILGEPYWFSYFETRPESDHPGLGGNPYGADAFYTEDSGGMLYDFPYAPNLIVTLLGSCKSVTGVAKLSVPDRYIVPENIYDQYIANAIDPYNSNYWETVVGLPRSEHVCMGAPDNVFSVYELANGFNGVFHVGRPFLPTLPGTGFGSLQIFGSEGNLIMGHGGNLASFTTKKQELVPSVDPNGWYHIPVQGDICKAKWPIPIPGGYNYYHASTQHFIECIQNDVDPLLNVEWGLHITEMMAGALESSKSGERYEMTTSVDISRFMETADQFEYKLLG